MASWILRRERKNLGSRIRRIPSFAAAQQTRRLTDCVHRGDAFGREAETAMKVGSASESESRFSMTSREAGARQRVRARLRAGAQLSFVVP
ncbi:hypothetical protein CDAR_94071 [Caerostris darwini]|uniref:Uncharacterized protein n=1 Tax=Caerostris darwini TaxID=1538125 RepID=A0AAV4NLA8_9ARAC|nr:hypothetical protein CDAR_94071 [Caerostris darwini]